MRVERTAIPDVLIVEPRVFGDARGFFFESWNRRTLAGLGIDHPHTTTSIVPTYLEQFHPRGQFAHYRF